MSATRAGLVVMLLLALLVSGCAVLSSTNRRTLNAMDEHWSPDTATGRWTAAPLGFPAAVVGLLVDALFVNPALAVDDAWDDTVEWLWTPDPDESRFRRAVIIPLAALATPLVYVGDWIRLGFFLKPHVEPDL